MVAYLAKAGEDLTHDPFITSSSRTDERIWLNFTNNSLHEGSYAKKRRNPTSRTTPYQTGAHQNKSQRHGAFWTRFYFAIFGEIALVRPMLLMILYKHLLTHY
jgi:hypothetical protein